jgi:hypothetical protein
MKVLILWIVVLTYLAAIIFIEMCRSAVYWLELEAGDNPDEILKKKKPFYTNKTRWNYIRKKAIEEKIEQEKYRSCTHNTEPYNSSNKFLIICMMDGDR